MNVLVRRFCGFSVAHVHYFCVVGSRVLITYLSLSSIVPWTIYCDTVHTGPGIPMTLTSGCSDPYWPRLINPVTCNGWHSDGWVGQFYSIFVEEILRLKWNCIYLNNSLVQELRERLHAINSPGRFLLLMYQSWHLFEVILNCSIFICDLFYCPHLSWLLKREDHSTRCYSFLCNKHEQRKFRSVLSLYAMLWKLCVHSDFWVHCGLGGNSWVLGSQENPLFMISWCTLRPIKLNPEQCSPHMERTSELYDFIFCVGRQPTICIYVVHFVYRPLLTLCCCMDDCELSVFLWSSCARICNDKVIFHTSAFKACLCIILKEKRFFFYKTCFY